MHGIEITLTELVRDGIAGKDKAITAYDDMLWKIRAGYASVLYAIATVSITLIDKTKWKVPQSQALAIAVALTVGFTIAAFVLNLQIIRSKLRVIDSKEELIDFTLRVQDGMDPKEWRGRPLKNLLHNCGEGRAHINWRRHSSIWPVVVLYCCSAIPILIACYVIAA